MNDISQHDDLPLPDYDHLPVGVLGSKISGLDERGVQQLLDYERAHADRLPVVQPALDWSTASTWEFQPLDSEVFPAVRLAREAGEAGGVVPALYNAANEEAVAAFTAGRLSFPGIVQLVARTLDEAPDLGAPTCVEDVLAAEKWAREHARGVIAGG